MSGTAISMPGILKVYMILQSLSLRKLSLSYWIAVIKFIFLQ